MIIVVATDFSPCSTAAARLAAAMARRQGGGPLPINAFGAPAAVGWVDVIAVGSHGRSGLARAWLGSVAEHVARRSRRPVFIVRTMADGTQAS